MEKSKYIVYTYGTITSDIAFRCVAHTKFVDYNDGFAVAYKEKPTGRKIIVDVIPLQTSIRINVYYADETECVIDERQ